MTEGRHLMFMQQPEHDYMTTASHCAITNSGAGFEPVKPTGGEPTPLPLSGCAKIKVSL